MIKKEDVFKIGQFAKPHGIKGEIALVTNSDVFDDSDDPYIICEMDGILVPFFIEEYRYETDTVILLKLRKRPVNFPTAKSFIRSMKWTGTTWWEI